MATPIELFNFYRRYKWRAQDFQSIQDALIAEADVLAQGAYKAAVLEGLTVTAATGLQVAVAAGIASGPTGNLMAQPSQVLLNVTAPTGGNPAKSLIVIRPLTVQQNYITKPTSPFESVPLNFTRDSELVFIQGTESATPEYPSKGSEDVILAGVKIATGQSSLTVNDFDFNIRESVGLNSEELNKKTLFHDERLLSYRSDYRTVGIKPSQTSASNSRPKMFLYPQRNTASIFPKSLSGVFNYADTFLNFQTGAITGGDAVSTDFTPVVPTSGNSIVATVLLLSNDTIDVKYGVQGTFSQCLAAIENQDVSGGAGTLNSAMANNFKVCHVVVTSVSGSISDVRVIDARIVGSGSSQAAANPVTSLFPFIVGTAAQVTAGLATHSTFASAQSAASNGDTIIFTDALALTENLVITKKLSINLNNAVVTGSAQFSSGSNYSRLYNGKLTDNVTVDSVVIGVVTDIILASGKTFIDNSVYNPYPQNALFAIQET